MKETKPELICIYSCVNLGQKLIDIRHGTAGSIFGTIKDVARQYGIKIEKSGKCLKFIGPASRLQIFAEKLHFSGVGYFE